MADDPLETAQQAWRRLRERPAARVLLADDNAVNRALMRELLGAAGCIVTAVNDGEQAVAQALQKPFDLVLMDLRMPGVDGFAAARAIRAGGKTLPIVATSAAGDDEGEREACLAAGMTDCLPKPIAPAALYEMMLRWLPLDAPQAAAPVPANAPLLARLAAIDGFDPECGLRNTGGHAEALARVLAHFASTYRSGLASLVDVDAADARERRRNAMHALLGVAATIGAVTLQGRVEDYERSAAQGADEGALISLARETNDELIALSGALEATLAASSGR